jgi:hypothetical protein
MSAVPNFAPFRQSHLGLHQTPPFDPGVGTQVLPDGWDEIPLWVPILASLPRLHNSPLAKCCCKKFCMDFHGDHTSTCTAHSGATKADNWMVSVLGQLFSTD